MKQVTNGSPKVQKLFLLKGFLTLLHYLPALCILSKITLKQFSLLSHSNYTMQKSTPSQSVGKIC